MSRTNRTKCGGFTIVKRRFCYPINGHSAWDDFKYEDLFAVYDSTGDFCQAFVLKREAVASIQENTLERCQLDKWNRPNNRLEN